MSVEDANGCGSGPGSKRVTAYPRRWSSTAAVLESPRNLDHPLPRALHRCLRRTLSNVTTSQDIQLHYSLNGFHHFWRPGNETHPPWLHNKCLRKTANRDGSVREFAKSRHAQKRETIKDH